MNLFQRIRESLARSLSLPRPMCRRVKVAMIDLETFDTAPTAAFYAVGGRMFKLGEFVEDSLIDPDNLPMFNPQDEDLLVYIQPEEMLNTIGLTSSADTIEWTMAKNLVEFRRAQDYGIDAHSALNRLDAWLAFHKPEYVASNSPNFDHSILRHAYQVLGRDVKALPHFRTDFDPRTIGHLRHEFGMRRYHPKGKSQRLHSPLDDCTLQINGVAGFIQAVEQNRF